MRQHKSLAGKKQLRSPAFCYTLLRMTVVELDPQSRHIDLATPPEKILEHIAQVRQKLRGEGADPVRLLFEAIEDGSDLVETFLTTLRYQDNPLRLSQRPGWLTKLTTTVPLTPARTKTAESLFTAALSDLPPLESTIAKLTYLEVKKVDVAQRIELLKEGITLLAAELGQYLARHQHCPLSLIQAAETLHTQARQLGDSKTQRWIVTCLVENLLAPEKEDIAVRSRVEAIGKALEIMARGPGAPAWVGNRVDQLEDLFTYQGSGDAFRPFACRFWTAAGATEKAVATLLRIDDPREMAQALIPIVEYLVRQGEDRDIDELAEVVFRKRLLAYNNDPNYEGEARALTHEMFSNAFKEYLLSDAFPRDRDDVLRLLGRGEFHQLLGTNSTVLDRFVRAAKISPPNTFVYKQAKRWMEEWLGILKHQGLPIDDAYTLLRLILAWKHH